MTNDAGPGPTATAPGGPPPPPPGVTGWAGRYGLVRPVTGRYVAGVCAGIARATNTDPVLWRVLVAVLALFGGVGLLIYLVGWLLTPAEGDSASPLEALVGRGHSRTSAPVVVLLGVLAVVMLTVVVSDTFYAAVLGVAVLVGAILLLNRRSIGPIGPEPLPPYPPPYPPPGPYPAPQPYPTSGPYLVTPPSQPPTPSPSQPPAPQGASGTQVNPMQPASPPVPPPAAPPPGAYRPPFAPHGPYAGPQYPPPKPPAPPVLPLPPKKPRERSPLGQIVLSLACVAIGVLAAIDVASGVIPVSAYFATVLGLIGIGLLVGAWMGRARLLIILGLVVAAALGISSGVESADRIRFDGGNVRWHPTTMEDLANRYDLGAGDAVLDLSDLDFTGQDRTVDASMTVGTMRVLLPPNVDVDVRAAMGAGDANVLGHQWGGFNQDTREFTDLGEDGTGGGHLRLVIDMKAGELEVTR